MWTTNNHVHGYCHKVPEIISSAAETSLWCFHVDPDDARLNFFLYTLLYFSMMFSLKRPPNSLGVQQYQCLALTYKALHSSNASVAWYFEQANLMPAVHGYMCWFQNANTLADYTQWCCLMRSWVWRVAPNFLAPFAMLRSTEDFRSNQWI